MKELYAMNEEILERLETFRQAFGCTEEKFSEWVDISQPFTNEYGLMADRFTKLTATFPQLQISWVLFGEGPMMVLKAEDCCHNCKDKVKVEGQLEGYLEACHLLRLQIIPTHPDALSRLEPLNDEG